MNDSINELSFKAKLVKSLEIMRPVLLTPIVCGFVLWLVDPVKTLAGVLVGLITAPFLSIGIAWTKQYRRAEDELDKLWRSRIPPTNSPMVGEQVNDTVTSDKSIQAISLPNCLPPIQDPTDARILEWVTKEPDLSDKELGQRLGISRQAANARRKKLQAMGYKVR
ncbi:MAG: winged helix-turn-helix domain-containing protein [Thermoflexales bacterium]|nr:winged helix-turn-helix domain-containing protein [Thermoflexales bacterium]